LTGLNPKTRFLETKTPVFGLVCALGLRLVLASVSFGVVIAVVAEQ
jgi:hypothetical protein